MARQILHMLSPLKHMSPFDVNMAADAGYEVISTYTDVTVDEVRGLVQDAIFSRSPSDAAKTGIFFAGKNALQALDMLKIAQESFVPPFEVNLFADPAGSFTTGAGMIACTEKLLRSKFGTDLKGKNVAIFGGTGVVSFCAAVLCAQEGGKVHLVGYDGVKRVGDIAREIGARFGVEVIPADGSDDDKKFALLKDAEIVLSAGPAGKQLVNAEQLASAKNLLVAGDVNAVPPEGVAGVTAFANGEPVGGNKGVALGALAIGNVKYQAQHRLFRKMIEHGMPLALDFRDAFVEARAFVA